MKTTTKIWLIAATALTLLGMVIFAIVMTGIKWDFTKLSTVKYQTTEYSITENYKNISVKTNTADVTVIPTDDSGTRVVCHEQTNIKHTVTVKDSTLTVEVNDTRKWYEHIGFSFRSTKITVYLPRGEYGALQMDSDTGDIEIPKDISFESIDIQNDTGKVTNLASASQSITVKTDTGDIRVEGLTTESVKLSVSTGKITVSDVNCNGSVEIKVSTGKSNITSLRCQSLTTSGSTGDINLKNVIATESFSIKRTTGDITLEGCDAADIFVTTDTGDVSGSLLSSKVFITKTDTGKVNVPGSVTGGRCEITTDTGDIKIQTP